MSSSWPWVLAVGGLVGALVAVAGLLAVAVVVARRVFRKPRADRPAMLRAVGFEPLDDGRWMRPVPGLPLTLEAVGDRWRWTGRLPRYGSLQLTISEREGRGLGAPPQQDELVTGDAELDERFVFRSDRPALALDVLADQVVGDLLLALPCVHLELRGDEIVVEAPSTPPTVDHLPAEARLHETVTRLCGAVVAAIPR